MKAFRYRTAVLVGPWRATLDSAVDDAIRAKQAQREGRDHDWRWIIPGEIEERDVKAVDPADNDDVAARLRRSRN